MNMLGFYVYSQQEKGLKLKYILKQIGISDDRYRSYLKFEDGDLPTKITEKIKRLNNDNV